MKSSELFRLLKREGWTIYRTGKGSHKILIRPDRPGIEIVFPDHGSNEIGKNTQAGTLK